MYACKLWAGNERVLQIINESLPIFLDGAVSQFLLKRLMYY